jgi:hypothetical protein
MQRGFADISFETPQLAVRGGVMGLFDAKRFRIEI